MTYFLDENPFAPVCQSPKAREGRIWQKLLAKRNVQAGQVIWVVKGNCPSSPEVVMWQWAALLSVVAMGRHGVALLFAELNHALPYLQVMAVTCGTTTR
jgi:hypothetical protein